MFGDLAFHIFSTFVCVKIRLRTFQFQTIPGSDTEPPYGSGGPLLYHPLHGLAPQMLGSPCIKTPYEPIAFLRTCFICDVYALVL